MSHRDGSLNLNRAVCNAAGDAERVEASSAEPENPSLMQGVYLENYVNVGTRLTSTFLLSSLRTLQLSCTGALVRGPNTTMRIA